MTLAYAVILDLGGTLMDPDLEGGADAYWNRCYDRLLKTLPEAAGQIGVGRETFVSAMAAAEADHWRRVNEELWSGPPSGLVGQGLERLGIPPRAPIVAAVLEGCARAMDGWAVAFPDAQSALSELKSAGYRLGLLSNMWWAAEWCQEDLRKRSLAGFFDAAVYTSEMPHSKPHPSVFMEISSRLGVEPKRCVMVGDRMRDDVQGAQGVGMRAVWVRNYNPYPVPAGVAPDAAIDRLAELPAVLRSWEAS